MIEPAEGGRCEALVNMAEHYREAYRRQKKAYAFTNWASAALLIQRFYPEQPLDQAPLLGLATLPKDIASLRKTLDKGNASAPSFWDSASLADLDLVQTMEESQPGKRRKASAAPESA